MFNLDVGCGNRYDIAQGLAISLNTTSPVSTATETATGSVDSGTVPVDHIWYTVNGGPPTDICSSDCGASPTFNFELPLACGTNTVVAYAHAPDLGRTASVTTTIVRDHCGNRPPVCSGAGPSVAELWPPNHKFNDISVTGVTDPDGDPFTITITGIRQDEPVNGLGDGNTCPDATGVGSSTASVRAERTGDPNMPGDGRVYHISFTASDGRGGTCTGEVTTCVPHDQRPGHVCVDEGPLFDSTVCPQP